MDGSDIIYNQWCPTAPDNEHEVVLSVRLEAIGGVYCLNDHRLSQVYGYVCQKNARQ